MYTQSNTQVFSKFFRFVFISVILAVFAVYAEVSLAQPKTAQDQKGEIGVLTSEFSCYHINSLNASTKGAIIIARSFSKIGEDISQDILMELPGGKIVVIKVLPEQFWCILLVFEKPIKI